MQQFLKGITSVINKLEFIWFLVFCGIFLFGFGFLIFYCTAKTVVATVEERWHIET